MSTVKSKEKLSEHKDNSIKKIDDFLTSLIENADDKDSGRADKISYWLNDWVNFLNFEKQFNPLSLRRYKRGEIIKVHLGFNIGSEEGGLHYAVVLDKNNFKSSPVVTIVPLTSVKPTTDVNCLRSGSIFLGDELYNNLNLKISTTIKRINTEINTLEELIKTDCDQTIIQPRISAAYSELDFIRRMQAENKKMKRGSIALVNQITTISKIRIYDPKTDYDILSGIRLSNEKLDIIDKEMIKKYTNLTA